eukprot:TRINITY_DN2048_c0_g1_i2.p1 TRINITY_DN2048_c0_g1~~TRINITY_DN2048_c0_g1_i2.p1  ORF type:complete len:268 (+),score=64.35 TRINITY_DN2048_c0_g1_i2:163-966(+)
MCIRDRVLTSPGCVPIKPHDSTHDQPAQLEHSAGDESETELMLSELPVESTPTYCAQCKQARPERAHHCKLCKCCVLVFDHHCGFVNNCVGYYNRGYFLQFLFWVVVATGTYLLLTSRPLLQLWRNTDGCVSSAGGTEDRCSERVLWLINRLHMLWLERLGLFCVWCSAGATFMLVGFLLGMQIPLVCYNATYIEWRTMEEVFSTQYNLGSVRQNLQQVFGTQLWLMWLPCRKIELPPLESVSYTHLRAHETVLDLVCRLLLEKKKQ